MKKIIVFAVSAMMMFSLFMLVSCGEKEQDLSDSKYVGTWKCTELKLQDESDSLSEEWTITLNGDGTGVSVGGDEDGEFTWKLVDGGFKTKGDVKCTFKDDGENIKTTMFGVDIIFVKQ